MTPPIKTNPFLPRKWRGPFHAKVNVYCVTIVRRAKRNGVNVPTRSFQQSRKDNPLDCSSAFLALRLRQRNTHTHTNTHTFYPSSKGRRRSNKKRETVEGVQRRKWAISFVTSIQRDGSRRPDGNPTEWVHIDPGYPPPPPLLHPLFPGETAPRPVANDGCTFTIVFTLLERGQGGVMINFPCTN